jgi:hypothetical protein
VNVSQRLAALAPTGYLEEAALWFAADVDAAAQDQAGAFRAIRTLAARPVLVAPVPTIQLRLAREARAAGDREDGDPRAPDDLFRLSVGAGSV